MVVSMHMNANNSNNTTHESTNTRCCGTVVMELRTSAAKIKTMDRTTNATRIRLSFGDLGVSFVKRSEGSYGFKSSLPIQFIQLLIGSNVNWRHIDPTNDGEDLVAAKTLPSINGRAAT